MKIIPTVFAKNKKEFDDKFGKVVKVSKEVQIDIMDGKFVNTRGILLKNVPDLRKNKNNFEAHLMVRNPELYILELKKKGFKKVLFHYESVNNIDNLKRIVFLIRDEKMSPWIVFNLETSFDKVLDVISRVEGLEGIMFMGVNPGREGQKIDLNTIRKVRNLKNLKKKIKIQVDGGVNDENISNLKEAGADVVNVGSFISKSKGIVEARKRLELLKKAVK